jgi:hypothetical protein
VLAYRQNANYLIWRWHADMSQLPSIFHGIQVSQQKSSLNLNLVIQTLPDGSTYTIAIRLSQTIPLGGRPSMKIVFSAIL